MLHLILYAPEIPQNAGNVGRTTAITQSRLHLIEPLGFSMAEKHLKRSGMDYWDNLDVQIHKNWEVFKKCPDSPKRLWLFTTHSEKPYWDVEFRDDDGLVFGNEGSGAPDWLHHEIGDDFRITIPHGNKSLRSLNLATAAGIATFEALRQIRA
ncbi:MAG: tRNA (uridine(34)/cytosine(34)/5-carboxymethylaminomethyluridine(34)-2'-O)-methyltransferase TrmL [Opitutaceae bacterium]|nr:tRNA (uridine(34)/cytosine(34)/5-carboxymethylaminomethyluridine(34)-2'-O)-methyltransferase TrmL [Opitutaceae bacterium]